MRSIRPATGLRFTWQSNTLNEDGNARQRPLASSSSFGGTALARRLTGRRPAHDDAVAHRRMARRVRGRNRRTCRGHGAEPAERPATARTKEAYQRKAADEGITLRWIGDSLRGDGIDEDIAIPQHPRQAGVLLAFGSGNACGGLRLARPSRRRPPPGSHAPSAPSRCRFHMLA